MGKVIDLTGDRYGKLVVIRRNGSINGKAAWLCRCDCGGEHTTKGVNLRHGDTKSCGCLAHNRLPEGESTFNAIYKNYKRNAKRDNREWDISKSEFKRLTKQNCYYCGVEPNQTTRRKGLNGSYTYNGVDRVDNDIGYTPTNTVSCCLVCNFMKAKLGESEFLEHVKRIYLHQAGTR